MCKDSKTIAIIEKGSRTLSLQVFSATSIETTLAEQISNTTKAKQEENSLEIIYMPAIHLTSERSEKVLNRFHSTGITKEVRRRKMQESFEHTKTARLLNTSLFS